MHFQREKRTRFVCILVLFGTLECGRLVAQALDEGDDPVQPAVIGPRDPRFVMAVRLAIAEAARRLATVECRLVFSDFLAGNGHTMQHALDEKGENPRSYLRWLIFQNASAEGICRGTDRVAATTAGGRIIQVCAKPFVEAQFLSGGYAAALVIHEELHSLGLEENPPTSREITLRVIARCGT